MTNYTRYKKNEGIKEIMTPKEITIYKMKREREIPYSEDLITKLQSLFGKNLVVDSYFYLIPLQKKLSIRKYLRRMIKSYMRYNRDFLLFSGKRPEEIKSKDIKKDLYYVVNQKKIFASILNIIVNALKSYYGEF